MAADHGHSQGHDAAAHHGPSTKTYLVVAFILALITAIEVWVYYIPGFPETAVFVPLLLGLSALKFAAVVAFYMHLKYDHKVFRGLFVGPFIIALGTIIALVLLFGYHQQ